MSYLFLINIVGFYLMAACLYWYALERSANIRNYEKWKCIRFISSLTATELMEKIRFLRKSGFYCLMVERDGIIYFRDRPGFRSWGNSYVLRQVSGGEFDVFYQGNMIRRIVNKGDLNVTIHLLKNDPVS